MDLETSHSPGKANVFHSHRLDHNPSKLPAFRFADLQRPNLGAVGVASPSLLSQGLESAPTSSNASHATEQGTLLPQPEGNSNFTTPTAFTPSSPKRRPATSPGESVTPLTASYFNNAPSHSTSNYVPKPQDRRFRRAPASHSSNGIETFTGPPPALSTQRSFAAEPARTTNNSTSEWALAQQQLAYQSLQYQESSIDNARSTSTKSHPRGASKSLDESILSRPLIPPIRSFRSSTTRPTLEMNGGSFHRFGAADEQEDDRDRTLRALEGLSDEEHNEQTSVRSMEQDGVRQTNATTEDLFLKLAQDDLTSQAGDEGRLKRADNGRVSQLSCLPCRAV